MQGGQPGVIQRETTARTRAARRAKLYSDGTYIGRVVAITRALGGGMAAWRLPGVGGYQALAVTRVRDLMHIVQVRTSAK